MFLTILLYFCTSILTLLYLVKYLNYIYEERNQTTNYTSSYSSKALILYEIRRVSIEVEEYRRIVRN